MNKQTNNYMIHVACDTYAQITKAEFERVIKRLVEVEKIEPDISRYKIDNINIHCLEPEKIF